MDFTYPVLSVSPDTVRLQGVPSVHIMSALPNPLHTQKKAPGQAARPAKLNKYGRDPQSPSERLRGSSDYDTEKGYAPFFHAFLADLPRLSSGNSCTLLLLALWSKSAGQGMKKGARRPEWTLALSVEDLAQICRCDVRTVERELAALDKRGLAELRRPAKGEVEARLKYKQWEELPDYKSQVITMDDHDTDVAVDPETVDESKPGNQRVTGRKSVRLAAGAISKVFPVSCGVKTFRHKAEGPVDMEFTCVVQAGELLVVSRFPDDWRQKVENAIPRSNGINENTPFPRHGCREDSVTIPSNGGSPIPTSATQALTVDHPRAAELIKIFDPLLAAGHVALLSSDLSSLSSACSAIQDCDHNYLVKFAMQRAARKIGSPRSIAPICTEALASSKASKVLTGAGLKDPIWDEIEAQAAREREALRVARENVRRKK
jgi:hypothetical protein